MKKIDDLQSFSDYSKVKRENNHVFYRYYNDCEAYCCLDNSLYCYKCNTETVDLEIVFNKANVLWMHKCPICGLNIITECELKISNAQEHLKLINKDEIVKKIKRQCIFTEETLHQYFSSKEVIKIIKKEKQNKIKNNKETLTYKKQNQEYYSSDPLGKMPKQKKRSIWS